MLTDEQIEHIFTYHNDPAAIPRYQAVREAAKELARVIVAQCPPCADTSAAIRKLRESVMTANAAIALKGHV